MSEKAGVIGVLLAPMGCGKTPVAQRLAENSGMINLPVYDKRREYDEKKYSLFYNPRIFREELPKFTDSFIIVEEAPTIMRAFRQDEFVDMVTGIMHNRNVALFLFQLPRFVPRYLADLTNFLIVLPPFDSIQVAEKFPATEGKMTEKKDYFFHLM